MRLLRACGPGKRARFGLGKGVWTGTPGCGKLKNEWEKIVLCLKPGYRLTPILLRNAMSIKSFQSKDSGQLVAILTNVGISIRLTNF